MGQARGNYAPRKGSTRHVEQLAEDEARRARLARSDETYRKALGIPPGEPLPRHLGAAVRGGGRPIPRQRAGSCGRGRSSLSGPAPVN